MPTKHTAADRLMTARVISGPRVTRFVPFRPTAKQAAMLILDDLEVFYGGAAGGGKSAGLLMAALQYVDVPGYSALLLRRTYPELSLADGLIPLANEWLQVTDARYRASSFTWQFPSGATLTFGYLQYEQDKYRYQGASFQFIGFDELTHFTETQYRYLFSRLRRPRLSDRFPPAADGLTLDRVPLRIRSASNPGGIGHDWVRGRLVSPATREPESVYIQAKLADNPHLDADSYVRSLFHLPKADRERLLNGDWDAYEPGPIFDRGMFNLVSQRTWPEMGRLVRAWDLAGTKPSALNPDPDWSVGTLYGPRKDGEGYVVLDVQRFRETPGRTKVRFRETARHDGRDVHIWLEQEPGNSGKAQIRDYQKAVPGYILKGYRPSVNKVVRAGPFAAAAGNDLVWVMNREWTQDFMHELERFPGGSHDDCVDSVTLAHYAITDKDAGRAKAGVPSGKIGAPEAPALPSNGKRGVARVPASVRPQRR